MANPTDFLLNTDYEMDKITYFYEGKISGTYANINHDLPFAPLVFGVWSKTSDFSEPHSFSYANIQDPLTDEHIIESVGITSNKVSSGNYIYVDKNYTPGDIYVRIYGFEPDDSYANVGSTSKKAKEFILNTDYNYRKIAKKGKVEVAHTEGGATYFDPVTIDHNLGYKPQVMVWYEAKIDSSFSVVEELKGSVLYTQNSPFYIGVMIDNKSITIYPNQTNFEKMWIHYRIYYDEAQ